MRVTYHDRTLDLTTIMELHRYCFSSDTTGWQSPEPLSRKEAKAIADEITNYHQLAAEDARFASFLLWGMGASVTIGIIAGIVEIYCR